MDTSRGHKRKISYRDLELTLGKAPLVQQPHGQQAAPQLTHAQLQAQQLENMRRNEHARRQARKPTDRDVPDELVDVIVGDGVLRYKKLRDAERKLDTVMMRKRLDVSDNLQRRYTRREGILRVWISNTAEGQPWQVLEENAGLDDDGMGTFELEESSRATYRVKIEGRLLDEPDAPEGEDGESAEQRRKNRPKLSHYFKSITVDLHRLASLQPDGTSAIEWRKPQQNTPNYDPKSSEANFDTLEFERRGDENINVTINLVRDEKGHERFKLSPELADVLDEEEDDMAGAVQGVWEYCRAMGLQEDDDRRSIVCDEPLRKLFNKDSVYFPHVPEFLKPHLHPLPPIQLAYTIRVDKAYINGSTDTDPETQPSAPTIYDIRVPLPNPLSAELNAFHARKSHLQDLQNIVKIDDELAVLVQKVHHTNAKRKFYENLARDPQNFVKRWVASQQRDLEVILAEATRGGGEDAAGEEFRRGGKEGLWGSDVARESVGLWLARTSNASNKPAAT